MNGAPTARAQDSGLAAAPLRKDTAVRRAVDVVLSSIGLILLAPVLLLVALLVRLTSPGPALYRAPRVGRGREEFPMFKFRSMVADANRRGPQVSGHRDPRVTRLGRVLRASKLDELPQLINVLRGEMTFVGPRAEAERYVRHYSTEELGLLEVRPGLTGPGQVYFTTHQAGELDRVDDPDAHYVERLLHPKLALDLDYLRRRTLRADFEVLASTLMALLGRRRKGGAG